MTKKKKQRSNRRLIPSILARVLPLLSSLIFLAFTACSFAPKKFDQYKQGEWSGKALVKGSDRKGVVNVKFAAIDGDKLRLDVTSAIGSHVASMLVTQDKLQYLVVANKQMVESKPNKDAMAQILKIPMEPTVLYNVLFDRPIENKNWSCTNDEQNYLKQCKELRSKLTVDWKSREGHKRIIDIQHSSGSVQLNLTDFNSSVSNPDQAFSLSAPASFKVIKR